MKNTLILINFIMNKLDLIRTNIKDLEETEPKDKCKNFTKIMRTIAVALELLQELTERVISLENQINNNTKN